MSDNHGAAQYASLAQVPHNLTRDNGNRVWQTTLTAEAKPRRPSWTRCANQIAARMMTYPQDTSNNTSPCASNASSSRIAVLPRTDLLDWSSAAYETFLPRPLGLEAFQKDALMPKTVQVSGNNVPGLSSTSICRLTYGPEGQQPGEIERKSETI